MQSTKNRKYKLLYKNFIKLKETVLIKKKIQKLRRKKWKNFVNFLERADKRLLLQSKVNRRPPEYICIAKSKYFLPTYCNRFKLNFKEYLIVKQKFLIFYGFFSKKFLKVLINKASSFPATLLEPYSPQFKLIKLLEYQLDVLLYHSFFVKSPRHASQLIRHKQIMVNGRIIINRKFIVKPGDIIEVVQNRQTFILENIKNLYTWPLEPKNVSINYRTLQIVVVKNFSDVNLAGKSQTGFNINYDDLINFYQ